MRSAEGPPRGGGVSRDCTKGGSPPPSPSLPASAGIRLPLRRRGSRFLPSRIRVAGTPPPRGGAISELWALTTWRDLAAGAVLFALIYVGLVVVLLLGPEA